MRRIRLALVGLAVVQMLSAQLSDKPESWLKLDGQYVADTDQSDLFALMIMTRPLMNPAGLERAKPEASAVAELGWRALAGGNFNSGSRMLGRFVAMRRGMAPGEWMDVAAAIQFQTDRRIVAPGTTLHPRIEPLFVFERPLKSVYTAHVTLLDTAGAAVKHAAAAKIESLQLQEFSVSTAGIRPGSYSVKYELKDAEGKMLASAVRPVLISDTLRARIEALERQREKIAASGVARKSLRHASAVESVEFIAGLYNRAMREPVSSDQERLHPFVSTLYGAQPPYYATDPIAADRDLPWAESLAGALLEGGDPIASRTGDVRLARRSIRDQSLRPYRLYVPPAYDASKKWPLAVVLHAEMGDEGSLFENCPVGQESTLVKLARERGYLLLAPQARSVAGDYSGATGAEILDTVERVKGMYSVDEAQVFLAGHSVGMLGALSLAMEPEARFAALAGVAAAPIRVFDYSRAPDIPVMVLQSTSDAYVPTDEGRRFGYVMQRRFKRFEYDELAGTDHFNAPATAALRLFNFFDGVRAGTWKPSGKPVPLPQSAQ